jgi:hypothetical protein
LKARLRELVLVLLLSVAILGAIMASNSSTDLALATTTCGVNGCVSTPELSSSTSYSYTGTSVSTISATSTSVSTSIYSSTTTTTATTTSTFFSYTSTISTSITTTSFSTSFTGTETSTNTNWVTVPTTTTSSSTYTNIVTKQGTSVSCPLALVTTGNWLEPYANFLRGFRNNDIQNTTAGSEFMLTFNNWYYYWAPSLSHSAATNPWVFKAVQFGVYPLIGILYASYYSYALIAPLSPEAGALTAGIVAASLIGAIFVAPIAYVTLRVIRRHRRLHISKQTAGPSLAWFTASMLMCVAAYATSSGQLLALGTSSMVFSMLSLGSLIGTRALAYVQLPFANYASRVFAFKRLAKMLL